MRWHLSEARRLLADMDTPTAQASAIRLDAWLRNEALATNTDHVPTKRIYQYGPNCVRNSRDLRAALAVLAERGRARLQEDGRRRVVVINPALLGDQSRSTRSSISTPAGAATVATLATVDRRKC